MGVLGYFAEALKTWLVTGLKQTDPVLFRQVVNGLAEARRLGWADRLVAESLHALEKRSAEW